MSLLKIPSDSSVYETRTSIIWQDPDGIVFSKSKPDVLTTSEAIRDDIERFRSLFGSGKLPIILEPADNKPLPPNDQRTLIQQEMNAIVKALAIITTSTLAKMTANIFFVLKPPAYPVKMFTDVEEAKKWIREVCHIKGDKHNAA